MQVKKYLFLFALALIACGGILLFAKEKPAEQHVWTRGIIVKEGPERSQVAELNKQTSLVSDIVKQMIAAGIAPEKITFTGAQSPNDVFGSGRINANNLIPPQGACSPAPCHWKFLPVVEKDKGWYVYGAGTSAADIIAYFEGVNPALCKWMRMQKVDHVIRPGLTDEDYIRPKQMTAPFDPEKPGVYSAQGGATTIRTKYDVLAGQSEGCFDNRGSDGADHLIYYSVLLAQ